MEACLGQSWRFSFFLYGYTHAAEQVVLQVKGDIAVLLNDAEDLDRGLEQIDV